MLDSHVAHDPTHDSISTRRTRTQVARSSRVTRSPARRGPGPLASLGFAVEDDMHASGNPIDHSRDTYDRGHGGDQIGEDASSRPVPQHPRGRGRREAISSFVCSLAATRLQVTAEPVNDLCSFVRSRRTAAHGVCGGVTMHGAEGLPCGTLIAIDAPRWIITKRYLTSRRRLASFGGRLQKNNCCSQGVDTFRHSPP